MISIAAFLLPKVCESAVAVDAVSALPGWSGVLPSKQYSGYLTVDSEGDPAKDPVVLWLNGGPGCSSLDGYLYENGPFHVTDNDTTKLYYNDYAWTKKASMLYLEAPAGVGFSYSDDVKDYKTDDSITAADNHKALDAFFTAYPEYAKNDFFITGESYAGVYIPTLALSIVTASPASSINLKGIAVGNGCTGSESGVCGNRGDAIRTPYLHAHGLFSDATMALITANCHFPLPARGGAGSSDACDKALDRMSDEVGHVSLYGIYGPCTSSPQQQQQQQQHTATRAPLSARLAEVLGYAAPPVGAVRITAAGPDACIDSHAGGDWINRDVTRQALHLHMPPAPSGNWSTCGNNISYSRTMTDEPKLVYPTLVKKIQVLIYNGDTDACVPYTDNEEWTSKFAKDNGLSVKDEWHAWHRDADDDQVAGYATKYDLNDFSFVTIKGAGHMVPQVKPKQALWMFEKFLAGNDF